MPPVAQMPGSGIPDIEVRSPLRCVWPRNKIVLVAIIILPFYAKRRASRYGKSAVKRNYEFCTSTKISFVDGIYRTYTIISDSHMLTSGRKIKCLVVKFSRPFQPMPAILHSAF